jgi:hypothetical protein
MTPFLRGFADELVKVALARTDSASAQGALAKLAELNLYRPPSNALGNERTPTPSNYNRDRGGQVMGAIPTQRMESPAAAPKPGWRPDPGYRPSTAGDPAAAPKPKSSAGGKKPGPGTGEPAWEMAGARQARISGEAAYNKGFSAKQTISPAANIKPGQFRLKPGQAPTRGRLDSPALRDQQWADQNAAHSQKAINSDSKPSRGFKV